LQPTTRLQDTLATLANSDNAWFIFNRGIEKEGLRVDQSGHISQRPHPTALGSALTHPSITTDYSESLLEFITPVKRNIPEVIDYLSQLHRFTYQQNPDELIWPGSMPCEIQNELEVPIAYYGESNIGKLKHVYRHGLWHRYGRTMQCIAGLHYNFSPSMELWQLLAQHSAREADKDFISESYFGLIRNFRRYSWMLLYLFGASPALDKSFVKGKTHNLDNWDATTLFGPYATSLRMSGLGYQNNAQKGMFVCFNSLPTYTKTLRQAMQTSLPRYEELGVCKDGVYQQLNTHVLQIENEYYADIRPKRNSLNGEKPLTALNHYGVEYIEVRCLDLNPFVAEGVTAEQLAFTDLFLLYCLINDSPVLSNAECEEVDNNHRQVVTDGRNPNFRLSHQGQKVSLPEWGSEIINDLLPLADLLDSRNGTEIYRTACSVMQARLNNPALTPSARVLAEMAAKQLSHTGFVLAKANELHKTLSTPLNAEQFGIWQELAQSSLHKQAEMEAETSLPFTQYLQEYLAKP
jgi:glutamate--cysteine ligase